MHRFATRRRIELISYYGLASVMLSISLSFPEVKTRSRTQGSYQSLHPRTTRYCRIGYEQQPDDSLQTHHRDQRTSDGRYHLRRRC
jgi:hypothetical protein